MFTKKQKVYLINMLNKLQEMPANNARKSTLQDIIRKLERQGSE